MKLHHIFEMAGPAQTCANCGKGPIHKTHNWVKGVGWKCRKVNLAPSTTPVADPVPSVSISKPAKTNRPIVGLSNPQWEMVSTDDFQHRDGGKARPGVPSEIEVLDDHVAFVFRDTDPEAARAWVQAFVTSNELPGGLAGTSQDGDYRNDLISVYVK
jgi:hypothetical protein